MTSWRGERTKQGGPEWKRRERWNRRRRALVRQRLSRLSVVPQCVSQTQDLEIAVKGESGTGHIKVFLVSGRGVGGCVCEAGMGEWCPFFWKYLSFGLGLMWKRTGPALTVLSAVQFLIFMQQIRKGEGKGVERRFLVKQKANLQLRQFSLRHFLLLGKWAGRLAVCIIHTHVVTHTRA